MKHTFPMTRLAPAALLSLLPAVLLAAGLDREANLSACMSGRSSCDRSQLTPAEPAAIPPDSGVASWTPASHLLLGGSHESLHV